MAKRKKNEKGERKMNRIILIGNGFDLAHGLKTSYKDFIDHLWYKIMNKAMTNSRGFYEDDLIKLDFPSNFLDTILYNTNNLEYKGLFFINQIKEYRKKYSSSSVKLEFIIKNKFLRDITNNLYIKNWVDIEEEYYKALIDCKNNKDNVKLLNNEFQYIKNALEDFLILQEKESLNINENIYNNIYSPILPNDFIEKQNDVNIEKMQFIVFNYTNTVKHYSKPNDTVIDFAYIHGQFKNPNNPIVFGYGDERDDYYEQIEKANNNELMKNIKSFNYLQTDIYRKAIHFLDDNDFQVYIMGHSCGTSDRTLLNTILEHENCKSIKIFYFIKKNEDGSKYVSFNDTAINLSRNFSKENKQRMRNIIVPLKHSTTLTGNSNEKT